MSVESDTMHYYAQLDRDNAMDMAVERESEGVSLKVYDQLIEWFGENLACALMPNNWVDLTPEDTIEEAREHFASWLDKTAVSNLEAD